MFDSGFSRSRRPLRAVAPPLLLLLAAALVGSIAHRQAA